MGNIAHYAKQAKAFRRTHPNTTWQRAMQIVAKGGSSKRKRHVSGTAAVGTTSVGRTRKRRVSGTAAVGKTRRKRGVSRGYLGNTGSQIVQVVKMGAGMAGGIALTHFVLRPIENKLAQNYPGVGKFMAGAEVLLGGLMALKARNPIVKSVGVGIMAGGVYGVMKQFHIHHESPSVSGVGEYTHTEIPVSNTVSGMLGNMHRKRINSPGYYQEGNSALVASSANNSQFSNQMHNDLYKSYLFA